MTGSVKNSHFNLRYLEIIFLYPLCENNSNSTRIIHCKRDDFTCELGLKIKSAYFSSHGFPIHCPVKINREHDLIQNKDDWIVLKQWCRTLPRSHFIENLFWSRSAEKSRLCESCLGVHHMKRDAFSSFTGSLENKILSGFFWNEVVRWCFTEWVKFV